MELIQYLERHFYNRQELLALSKVTTEELLKYQQQEMMPNCSYRVSFELKSDSFFGAHQEAHETEYYAKGYASWLGIVKTLESKEHVYEHFYQRYIRKIAELKKLGHWSDDPKVNAQIDLHISSEWKYFLDGTYGLCTQSGLPEDIAAKELAILEINQLSSEESLTVEQTAQLTKAVNLLDEASSLFAPHERPKSSRQRLINDIRRRFQLSA
ncbi:DUF6058 family natural product biosynthesis protein [Pleionea sp. CnH1-48]|uniref:DUF6058 family natural product biosynthesis protein n=1 Tax=Pleionea sp. CnH1-48 TaxID=2954494 RepID=UPI0020983422|nr:DUF6058 family natural product biosynthesis protein [Pleionea sp. CnH1-48]MCO7223512.1 DUF6058 family natural product biosynthesis protein [Pleionea sp. CnH1-48]